MNCEEIRELFEKHFIKDNNLKKDDTGKYKDPIICATWYGWEAAFVWHKIKRLDTLEHIAGGMYER